MLIFRADLPMFGFCSFFGGNLENRCRQQNSIFLLEISAVKKKDTRLKMSTLKAIPLFRTASGQRTFHYRATSLWNELQPSLKLSPSVTVFKRLLGQKLVNGCFSQSTSFSFFYHCLAIVLSYVMLN